MYTLLCTEICCCTLYISLHCGCNLTLVSTVCEAALISLSGPQWTGSDWLANHSKYKKPGTQVKAKNKDFSAVLQTDLTTSLVPSVSQVICACNVVFYNAKIKQNAPFFPQHQLPHRSTFAMQENTLRG